MVVKDNPQSPTFHPNSSLSLWVTLTPPGLHPFTLPLIFRSDYYVRS